MPMLSSRSLVLILLHRMVIFHPCMRCNKMLTSNAMTLLEEGTQPLVADNAAPLGEHNDDDYVDLKALPVPSAAATS